MTDNTIKIGEFIVVQKHNYKKIHKLNKPNSSVSLGRDSIINLGGIEGNPYHSLFRMIPSSKKGKEYRLELADEVLELKDEIDIKTSGSDNRNIIDDGRSQKLSAAEIADLTNDATKASDIVETLISNSNTFHNKTEFSQEKYLRKKEKKYCEYVEILKPNLRLITEIMYRLDPGKIQHIRMDTLSQMITLSNIHCDGVHLLYDSGSNGLVAAALLSAIGANTNGKLIHMHPGNMSQKQALQAMNFSEEHLNRCVSVNIYSALRQYYQGTDTHNVDKKEANTLKRKGDDLENGEPKIPKLDTEVTNQTESSIKNSDSLKATKSEENGTDNSKIEQTERREPKKPKWHFDNLAASELLTHKVDSLIIACKEDPLSIFNELLQFVKPSRPFVVYFNVAEPLQNMFLELKSNPRVAALKLTCNWMRNYQVLPERTHPEVTMNNQSGFILSGYTLK